MSTIFDQMLSRYGTISKQDKLNATYEVTQQIALAGLYRGGFFDKAAFYGGTCLRMFHGLRRFSEDMDFSLLSKDESFNIEDYFPSVIEEFKAAGRDVTIKKKDKRNFGRVESAFLKDNTNAYDISFQTEKSIKVKIEVDICPPSNFSTEQKLLLQPFSFMARCFALPDLYAGKMHALVFRNWKNRVKGRDWYDFEWNVRANIPLDFAHLQERIKEFNGEDMSRLQYLDLLKERIATTPIGLVKADVLPYIKNQAEIDIWSNDYFLQLVDMIKWE